MDYFQLPFYIYIVIVSSLEKRAFQSYAAFVISVMSALVLTPFVSIVLLTCRIYQQVISWSLRKLLSTDFIGLMEGLDSICCNQTNCIPNIFLLIDTQEDISMLHAKTLQLLECAIKSEHKKLFYSRDTFMGYHYFVKNQLTPEDYILVSDDGPTITSKAQLSRAFQAIDQKLMPDEGRALLQIVLFRPSLQMDIYESKRLRIVGFRLHHSLGDGRAIMNLFVSVFGDIGQTSNKGQPSKPSSRRLVPQINRVKDWPPGLRDENPLRGYKLSERKHLAWFSDWDTSCMTQIRDLRHAVPELTFLDVVNTCIGSSLHDHCKRNSLPMPRTIVAGVVLSPEIYSFSYGNGNFLLNNRFSGAAIHLPISESTLAERLLIVQEEYQRIRKCVDVQLNYWIAQLVCNIIPAPFVRAVCERVPVTVGVSSLPGCEHFTLFAGCPVEDFIFMLPNSPKCGLHFVIYTYDGHFRVALTADDSILKTHHDSQMIIDDLVSYLHNLHQLSMDGSIN